MIFRHFIALLLLLLLLTGCAPVIHTISYNTDDLRPKINVKLQGVSFDVQIFKDVRKTEPSNKHQFEMKRKATINGKRWCINAEEGYSDVPGNISRTVAQHLGKRLAFKQVTCNDKANADFHLVGKIKVFMGQQEFSDKKSFVGDQGFIGMLFSSPPATGAKLQITLIDMEIRDHRDGTVHCLEDIDKTVKHEYRFDKGCRCIYEQMNLLLMKAVTGLADAVDAAMVRVLEKK